MSDSTPIAALVDLAERVLSLPQLRSFLFVVVAGHSEQTTGDRYGISQPAIHMHLHGRRKKPGAPLTGGALSALREAINLDQNIMTALNLSSPIEDDQQLLELVVALKTAPKGNSRLLVGVQPNPAYVSALAVLSVINALVDDDRRVTFTRLHEVAHPAIVAAAIPVLRAHGKLQSDGQTIRVLS